MEEFAAFLVQFLGGPAADTQRRWWVSLHESHRRFRLDQRHKDAWMSHMTAALEEVGIEEPARTSLRGFFDLASGYASGSKATTRRLTRELAQRWSVQRGADEAVAAIRRGDAARAILLAAKCERAILVGLLGLMIGAGHVEFLQYVQERMEADPSMLEERYGGRTLLHTAAGVGSLRMVKLLLRLGADPNALDGGKHTPLYCTGNECACAESADVVHALVRGGARVDAADGVTGATALHMAARRGNAVVARALLDCGADIQAQDRRGDTALQRAINCRKPHVAELLRSWGKN